MSLVSSALGAMTGGLSPLVGALAIGGMVLSIAGGTGVWFHEHDARIVAQVTAKEAVAVAAAQHEEDQRIIAGLAVAAKQANERAAATTHLKEAINAAPTSRSCAASPAVAALLSGLRGGAGGNDGAAPATPAKHVAVPGPTRATQR